MNNQFFVKSIYHIKIRESHNQQIQNKHKNFTKIFDIIYFLFIL